MSRIFVFVLIIVSLLVAAPAMAQDTPPVCYDGTTPDQAWQQNIKLVEESSSLNAALLLLEAERNAHAVQANKDAIQSIIDSAQARLAELEELILPDCQQYAWELYHQGRVAEALAAIAETSDLQVIQTFYTIVFLDGLYKNSTSQLEDAFEGASEAGALRLTNYGPTPDSEWLYFVEIVRVHSPVDFPVVVSYLHQYVGSDLDRAYIAWQNAWAWLEAENDKAAQQYYEEYLRLGGTAYWQIQVSIWELDLVKYERQLISHYQGQIDFQIAPREGIDDQTRLEWLVAGYEGLARVYEANDFNSTAANLRAAAAEVAMALDGHLFAQHWMLVLRFGGRRGTDEIVGLFGSYDWSLPGAWQVAGRFAEYSAFTGLYIRDALAALQNFTDVRLTLVSWGL